MRAFDPGSERPRRDDPPATLHLAFSSFRVHPDIPITLLRAAKAGSRRAASKATARTDTMVGERIVVVVDSVGLTEGDDDAEARGV